MKISGYTIVRNAIKYNYPALESIQSILPICDEFIVNVGDSTDHTLALIQSLNNPKIRIIQSKWDMSEGKYVLARQTNIALKECQGDWAFYLQSDEVIHEKDLLKLKKKMIAAYQEDEVDAFRFKWMHFYGSYYRYRIDSGWFQKQDRIIRNNGQIESFGDAYGFKRKDNSPLRRQHSDCLLFHYGWVHSEDVMTERRLNAENIGFATLKKEERLQQYSYGNLKRFPPYFGSHPQVMLQRVDNHVLSQEDQKKIRQSYWWHPCKILKIRYKTSKRIKQRIN